MRFKPLSHRRCVVVHFGNKNSIRAKQMANKDIHNNVGNRALLYSFLIIFVVFMFAINVLLWSICEKYKLANEQQQKIILEYVVQQERKH